jgi:protein SCO1
MKLATPQSLLIISAFVAAACSGETASAKPLDVLRDVGIDQRLEAQVPLDLSFRDESGAAVRLGDYFGDRPVILVLAYYRCPMLCTQVLNGLVNTMRGMDFELGKQYRVLTVSFDPSEGPELAAGKKSTYSESYARAGTRDGWHFLTGEQGAIAKLTAAAGFRYVFDPALNQFAHGSGIMVLTPAGRISHYFLGIDFSPRDVRLALVEASRGQIGSPVDRLLLLCYHYDPLTGKYSAPAMIFVRIAAVATLFLVAVPISRAWYREWTRGRAVAANTEHA